MPRFSTESGYVWITDIYHKHYPNYVKILEVLPDGYLVQVQTAVLKDVNEGPKIFLREDQMSDNVMGD